jgi:hypothetical protein
MAYMRLIICGVGAKVSMNDRYESNPNHNFNDHFMNKLQRDGETFMEI